MRRFISPLVIAPLVMVGLLVSCGSDSADVVETQAPMTEAPTSEAPADRVMGLADCTNICVVKVTRSPAARWHG